MSNNMSRTWSRAFVATATTLLLSTTAVAALPSGTVTYLQPTGTAGPHDSIPVWVRFTLDEDSYPIVYDNGDLLSALDPADLPLQGSYDLPGGGSEMRDFSTYSFATLSTWFVCSGNFSSGCDDSVNYRWKFNINGETGLPEIASASHNLGPGDSFDYVFAVFEPQSGGAAPGTYSYTSTGISIQIYGEDADGHALFASFDIASNYGESFTRTVTPVPEPQAWAMLCVGLAFVGSFAVRRVPRA